MCGRSATRGYVIFGCGVACADRCRVFFLGVVVDDQAVVALVGTVVEIGQFLGDQALGVRAIYVGADVLDVGIDHGGIDEWRRPTARRVRPETLRRGGRGGRRGLFAG